MLSEYEQIRHDNIKRNEEFLSEIGLNSLSQRISEGASSSKKGVKRSRDVREEDLSTVRRSTRISEVVVTHQQLSYSDEEGEARKSQSRKTAKSVRPAQRKSSSNSKPIPLDSNSARAIAADYSVFVSTDPGNNNLGSIVQDLAFGKAAVMAASNGGSCPKFSKYSGVVEWKNCVYLWVNITPKGDFVNEFTESGKYMTWYGGARMHEDSPVTKRLLSISAKNNTVVLFVRIEGEPYCCLGPVRSVQSDTKTQPIFVKWELLLIDKLQTVPTFKKILSLT
jgi:hypothetical protein